MKWPLAPLIVLLFLSLGQAEEALFDPDPQHPWNRLHRSLYTRTMPDGTRYREEGLEPLFVRRSSFLTTGDSHQQALERLDEFLKQKAEKLCDDPVKRAILQRDLWAVFVTTADPLLPRQPQRRELQRRLAQVMRRVALTAKEIEQLPDNLAQAVQSGAFAKEYQAEQPQRAFLPDDLLKKDGRWVLVKNRLRRDDQAAPLHVAATHGRSAFFMLIRLPGGRRTTLDYLKTLQELPAGVEIPQIPPGTHVALLRRMMLVDDQGTLQLTPLTESLQIRVYETLTAPDMFEFQLRRRELFAGRARGLRAIAADEIKYFDLGFLGLNSQFHPDPFETQFPPSQQRRTPVIMKSCVACHAGPGIFGFQSMFVDHFDRPPLAPGELMDQVTPLVERTYQTYDWGLLQGLWESGA